MPLGLEVVQGDITTVDVEAIVNAANNEFWMGSGVAGAIKARGGLEIEDEAMRQGPVIPGAAIHTTAGTLPYSYVIHAAVMGQDLRTTDKLIRQATVASLNLAEHLRLTSIAFPAFGTGVGGFPVQACANLMIAAVSGYATLAKSLHRVVFCLYDDVTFGVFRDTLNRTNRRAP
jgi:O-acetyl-ADP-ribose deacetylase (regulator of RNase III)